MFPRKPCAGSRVRGGLHQTMHMGSRGARELCVFPVVAVTRCPHRMAKTTRVCHFTGLGTGCRGCPGLPSRRGPAALPSAGSRDNPCQCFLSFQKPLTLPVRPHPPTQRHCSSLTSGMLMWAPATEGTGSLLKCLTWEDRAHWEIQDTLQSLNRSYLQGPLCHVIPRARTLACLGALPHLLYCDSVYPCH